MKQDYDDMRDRLDTLVQQCRQERHQFFTAPPPQSRNPCIGERPVYPPSPACIHLFRRAFAGDQEAWKAVYELWHPQIVAWIRTMGHELPGPEHHDLDDLIQEAWYRFLHYAPACPDLLATDDLYSVLCYMRKCAKTATMKDHRDRGRQKVEGSWSDEADRTQEGVAVQVERMETRREFWEIALSHAHTEDERLVLRGYFHDGLKHRDIGQQYPERFHTTVQVEVVVRRLKRRMVRDQRLWDLLR